MSSSRATLAALLGPEEAALVESWVSGGNTEVSPERVEAHADRVRAASRYSALQGAVGAILLRSMQPRLPRAALFLPKQKVLAISRDKPKPARSSVRILGQHLFTIDWINPFEGPPGISWPTAYYAVWLPIREIWVVTASDDTGEMLGFLDVALGWFPATREWEDGVSAILTEDWSAWARDGQPGWEELWSRGRLSATAIYTCQERAWPEEETEELAADE